MSIAISTGLNEARLQATANYIDSGSGAGYFAVYGNTRPGSITDAPGASPLVLVPLAEPCGTVVSDQLSLASGGLGMVASSGVAAWARLFNGNNEAVLDCDVSLPAGTGELKLSTVTLYAGAEVTIASAVLG